MSEKCDYIANILAQFDGIVDCLVTSLNEHTVLCAVALTRSMHFFLINNQRVTSKESVKITQNVQVLRISRICFTVDIQIAYIECAQTKYFSILAVPIDLQFQNSSAPKMEKSKIVTQVKMSHFNVNDDTSTSKNEGRNKKKIKTVSISLRRGRSAGTPLTQATQATQGAHNSNYVDFSSSAEATNVSDGMLPLYTNEIMGCCVLSRFFPDSKERGQLFFLVYGNFGVIRTEQYPDPSVRVLTSFPCSALSCEFHNGTHLALAVHEQSRTLSIIDASLGGILFTQKIGNRTGLPIFPADTICFISTSDRVGQSGQSEGRDQFDNDSDADADRVVTKLRLPGDIGSPGLTQPAMTQGGFYYSQNSYSSEASPVRSPVREQEQQKQSEPVVCVEECSEMMQVEHGRCTPAVALALALEKRSADLVPKTIVVPRPLPLPPLGIESEKEWQFKYLSSLLSLDPEQSLNSPEHRESAWNRDENSGNYRNSPQKAEQQQSEVRCVQERSILLCHSSGQDSILVSVLSGEHATQVEKVISEFGDRRGALSQRQQSLVSQDEATMEKASSLAGCDDPKLVDGKHGKRDRDRDGPSRRSTRLVSGIEVDGFDVVDGVEPDEHKCMTTKPLRLLGSHSVLALQKVPNHDCEEEGDVLWKLSRFIRPVRGKEEETSNTKQVLLPKGMSPLLKYGRVSRGSYFDSPDGGILLCREESGVISVIDI